MPSACVDLLIGEVCSHVANWIIPLKHRVLARTWCSAAVSTSSLEPVPECKDKDSLSTTQGIVGRSLLVNVQMDDGSTQEVPCGLLRPAQPLPYTVLLDAPELEASQAQLSAVSVFRQAKKRSRSPRSPHSTDKLCFMPRTGQVRLRRNKTNQGAVADILQVKNFCDAIVRRL